MVNLNWDLGGKVMAEETQIQEGGNVPMKRRLGQKKGGKGKKKMKVYKGSGEKVKVNKKMQKIFRKRARDYNSDDSDEEDNDDDGDEELPVIRSKKNQRREKEEEVDDKSSDDDGEDGEDKGEDFEESEDEDGEIQSGITKFAKGCDAFRKAFNKITKKSVPDSVLVSFLCYVYNFCCICMCMILIATVFVGSCIISAPEAYS